MSLSGVKSATALFNLVFSCSSSFKRFAWDIFIPPYSLSPVVISLFCDPEIPAHLPDALALRQMNLCLPKHPDDLLDCKTIPLHPALLSASDSATSLTQNLDEFLGVRPRAPGPVRILFSGRLLSTKGIVELVNAARLLAARSHDATIRICGENDPGNPASVTEE